MIQIQRVYHEASPRDGLRILVDRLWPCGLKKEAAHMQEWRKDLAPREALRRWFKHDPVKWSEFRRRYRQELAKDATMEGCVSWPPTTTQADHIGLRGCR